MRATGVSCTQLLQAARCRTFRARLLQTPRLQALLAGSYQVPTPAGDLLLRADYAWQDKIQFNVINDFNCQGAYGTVEGDCRRNPAR
jgi:outer membrane receptor for ferric coprogen and ferric-rhodotorulic acid